MKKSLLALAVVAAATSANAATVYDKDGTSLAVGGRVQSVVYNGNADAAEIAEKDAGLVNSARLNIAGSTKINDSVSVFAFSEWNMADGNKSATGDNINTREQYVGADYGDFGKILGGKTYDAANAVLAATDVFEDFGARLQSSINGDRRTGMFMTITVSLVLFHTRPQLMVHQLQATRLMLKVVLQLLLVTLSITLYLAHYHSRQVTHTSRVRMISLRPSVSLRIQRLLITSR